MKTNSLSSFVPTVHSQKEQAGMLRGKKKKKSNSTKRWHTALRGWHCCGNKGAAHPQSKVTDLTVLSLGHPQVGSASPTSQ